jgi:trk system potassium uptake protein TrkH
MGVNGMSLRFCAILRVLGAIVGLSSLISLPPLLIAVALDEQSASAFLESLLLALSIGMAMWFPVRRASYELRLRDGFFIVTMTWVAASLVTALPFMLAPPHLSFVDAVFESVSGITTTGATVIIGLDALPRSVLFFRQSLNFMGGMGIVILAVAILPMLKIGGNQLFRAESTGPVKDTKLTPRIADTAKALWLVYLALNILCALAYWLAGMNLFDAIGHAMATLATGGFSTHDASFAYWDSTLLDTIGIVFMLLGGINFGLHWYAWRRATLAHYQQDSELRSFLALFAIVALLITASNFLAGAFGSVAQSLRHSAFQTASVLTSTGFTTTGYGGWPGMAPLLLLFVACIGGSSGSTSGGMKVARVVMLLRTGLREVKQLVHPNGQFLVKIGGKRVSESIVITVGGFCTLYVISVCVLTLALAATGLDFAVAFSAIVACINNMGPGIGLVSSNFQSVGDGGIWICTFAMILGRLEVFPILVLVTPHFWRE